jgi:hypothetical protein
MSVPTTVEVREGFHRGPERAPHNSAFAAARRTTGAPSAPTATNIHDDATAQKLGFKGGTIAGSIHMDQFVPVLLDAFGPRWFETGSLSLAFRNATISGEPVVALVAEAVDGSDVQVQARMERPDGEVVAEGTAAVGAPPEPTHLESIDMRPASDLSALRILAGIAPGHALPGHEVTLDHAHLAARIDAGALTEPIDWYVQASPWGGPVANPSSMVQLLRNRPGDFGPHVGEAVGLFGAIELRHHHGPVLFGEPYRVEGEVVAVGASPRTEYVWYDTRAFDRDQRLVASMRMQLRWMTASSPLYARSPLQGPESSPREVEG